MTLKKLLFLIAFASLLITMIQVSCDDLVTEQIFITEAGHPIANFSLDSGYKDHSCDTLTVKFKDISEGPRDKWLWKFGDGDSSTDSAPTHFYSENGLYNVSLRIEDTETEGVGSTTKKRFILIGSATADFTATPDSGCYGMTVQFEPDDYDDQHTYRWSFGDGATILDATPTHTYDTVGTFEVMMTVQGDTCGDIFIYDTVIVSPCPTAVVYVEESEGCVPYTVNFFDSSFAFSENYVMLRAQSDWDFGDGSVLNNTQDPEYTYTVPGVYTVTLTAESDGGTATDSFVDLITVHDSTRASFTYIGDQENCKSDYSQFQLKLVNTSTGTIDSTYWEIANDIDTFATLSTDTSAILAVTSTGIYNIRMITYGYCGIDTATRIDEIIYSESLVGKLDSLNQLLPEFSYPDSTYGLEYFTSGVVSSWLWEFGDGGGSQPFDNPVFHTYADTGHFEVKLTLRNACDSIVIIDTVVVVPEPPPGNN